MVNIPYSSKVGQNPKRVERFKSQSQLVISGNVEYMYCIVECQWCLEFAIKKFCLNN